MTIDTSGKWWVGTEAADIADYLTAFKAEGYEVHETRLCKCGCGSAAFVLEADRDEGCALRTCAVCSSKHFICDSAEFWEEAKPEAWKCTECQSDTCNMGVGFSLHEPEGGRQPDVRWISIGQRCTKCGTLGCFVDWKVGYGPSHHLLGQA